MSTIAWLTFHYYNFVHVWYVKLNFIFLSEHAQSAIKCIYPNVIFTKLKYSAFEKEEDFATDLNLENNQNVEGGNCQDITPKTKLPSSLVETDVDMASLEDSYKDPVNNGYFCRQVRLMIKHYFCFFKKGTLASTAEALWAYPENWWCN